MVSSYLELSVLGRVLPRGKQLQKLNSPNRVYSPVLRVFCRDGYYIERGLRARGLEDSGDLKIEMQIKHVSPKVVLRILRDYLLHDGLRGDWVERGDDCEIVYPGQYLNDGNLDKLVSGVENWNEWLPTAIEGKHNP